MKKYIIIICIIALLVVIGFGVYFAYKNINSESDIGTVKSKADQEIKYLDTKIISLLNTFNHISYANYKTVETQIPITNQKDSQQGSSASSSSGSGSSQSSDSSSQGSSGNSSNEVTESINIVPDGILTNTDDKVGWNSIKGEIESMYSIWPTILIDLNSLNVNGDNLLKYTDTLDNTVKSLEKKDKKVSISNLAQLYNLLGLYLKDYSNDSKKIHLLSTRSYIVNAYALAEYDDKWDEMKRNIMKAKTEYSNIVNSPLENSNDINSINKGYILLNEMEKNMNQKDKKIFYVNYKNLMQELEAML